MSRGLVLLTVAVIAMVHATPLAAQRSDTVVRGAGAPRYPGVATLVPEVTIGGGDAAEEYQFDFIRAVLLAKDGSIWVADGPFLPTAGRQMVRRFDSTGKFIRHVGRLGDGPGEWQRPDGMAQLRDGRVILRDAFVGRPLTLYKSNGDYDTTWAFHTSTVHSVASDTTGVVWIRTSPGLTMSAAGAVYVRFRADGKVIDTVVEPPTVQVKRGPMLTVSGRGRGTNRFAAPFQPHPINAWSPLGFFVRGVTTAYAIDLHVPRVPQRGALPVWKAGDPIVSIRRDAKTVEVSEAERRDQRAYIDAMAAYRPGTRSGATPEIPRAKPPIKGAGFDDDGRMWVLVSMPSERYEPPPPAPPRAGQPAMPVNKWREPIVYDVFEPDGIYVGRVAFPWDVRFAFSTTTRMRGNVVWAVVTDDDGVQMLRRYRIAWK